MKTKKTKRANLENFRTIFFQIGAIITLSAILFAFEWNSSVKIEKLDYDNGVLWKDNEILPPVTKPMPEIKEVRPPSFNLKVVDNNKDFQEEDLADLFKNIEEYEPVNIGDFESGDEVVEEDPVVVAQIMPKFQGKGVNSFRSYIAEHIHFPNRAKETGVTGTVYATFVIDKDGSVIDVQIIRGVHPDVDNAVIKVIKSSPKWEPGFNNGRYVKVRYTIPVSFKLI